MDQQRRAGTVATRDHVRPSSFAIGDPAALALEAVAFKQLEASLLEPAQPCVKVGANDASVDLGRKPSVRVVAHPKRSMLIYVVGRRGVLIEFSFRLRNQSFDLVDELSGGGHPVLCFLPLPQSPEPFGFSKQIEEFRHARFGLLCACGHQLSRPMKGPRVIGRPPHCHRWWLRRRGIYP
jgi:hypothetical protein